VKVRALEWGDFPSLVDQYLDVYDEVRTDPEIGILLFPQRPTMGEEVEWFARLYRECLEGSAIGRVVEEGGVARGLCTVRRKGLQREWAHIGVLGILLAREFRSRGLGRTLLMDTLARCRGQFDLVELGVFGTNTRAQKLYRELGFREYGRQPDGVRREGRSIDHVLMSLRLAPERDGPPPASGNR
jgi:RimJ/RimL family protein N-acetyltransferase